MLSFIIVVVVVESLHSKSTLIKTQANCTKCFLTSFEEGEVSIKVSRKFPKASQDRGRESRAPSEPATPSSLPPSKPTSHGFKLLWRWASLALTLLLPMTPICMVSRLRTSALLIVPSGRVYPKILSHSVNMGACFFSLCSNSFLSSHG